MNANKPDKPNSSPGVYTSVEELLGLRYLAKDITLDTRSSSSAILDGDSRTRFRGRGMEFSEVRPYQAGDDIRNIDWRVTARTQKPYTKLFQEEKERPVFLLVDQRSPMFFGSTRVFKSVYAAQLACVIAWAALANNDRIGALLFADTQQKDLRPRRGKHAVLNLVHELQNYNRMLNNPVPVENSYALQDMLMDLRRIAKPGSAIYLLGDFHDYSESCDESLSVLARHTDLSVINIYDRLEAQLPGKSQLTVSNNTTRLTVNTSTGNFASHFENAFSQRIAGLRNACQRSRITFASMEVGTPIEERVRDTFVSKLSKKRSQVRQPSSQEPSLGGQA